MSCWLISLYAATVCTAHTCTKRLDKTQWPKTWDETYCAETETYCSETERRPESHRSENWEFCPRWDRDVSTSWDRLEIETSRPRPHPWWYGYRGTLCLHPFINITYYWLYHKYHQTRCIWRERAEDLAVNPALHFWPSFSSLAFSGPEFSAPPRATPLTTSLLSVNLRQVKTQIKWRVRYTVHKRTRFSNSN